ncbi:multidrug-efflux transporter 1 regulator [Clostridium tepidiprofundi DSM 19306]|uniref:Multidrug-efflux transporter 1 regulator n=1 Tax=Clostridium tepidiprofundi DSM 19306 TaxID=1121338 RepID=A0A151AS80_9CLOT|nr:MerR family transcriptional regulator [Clostridium tepidiprofundi]KYH30508.1 multidrug-efflux transporter 1 regulator [Clostridium tepidiprofundi DSM 19306]
MKNTYTIGQMAKLHNISVHTLRYYDKIGLLKPSKVDLNSNYRYYDDYDSHRLSKIKGLKSIGLPLNKIKILMEGTIDKVEEEFYDMRKELITKINNLNEVVSYLDEQLHQIEEFKKGECCIEPKILTFDRREGYIICVNESSSLNERIKAIVNFEKKNNTNADVFFKPTRLMHIDSDGRAHLKNYLALKRDISVDDPNDCYILEAGKYGVIDHIGSSKNIDESYMKLLKYIYSKGLRPCNEAIEILVMSSNLTVKQEEWRKQIQIRII